MKWRVIFCCLLINSVQLWAAVVHITKDVLIELTNAENDVKENRQQILELKKQLELLPDEIKKIQNIINEYADQEKKYKLQFNEVNNSLENFLGDIRSLGSGLDSLEKAKKRINDLNNDIKKKKKKIKKLKKEIEDAPIYRVDVGTEKSAKIVALEAEIAEKKVEKATLQGIVNTAEGLGSVIEKGARIIGGELAQPALNLFKSINTLLTSLEVLIVSPAQPLVSVLTSQKEMLVLIDQIVIEQDKALEAIAGLKKYMQELEKTEF